MPYRKTPFAPQETYRVCGRGNHKEIIFDNDSDYARFLFAVLFMQGDNTFPQVGRHVNNFLKYQSFNVELDVINDISKTRSVRLVHFTIMPNHFHLLLTEKSEGGISRYMERVLKSYAKYRSKKRNLSGHVFQGPFRATHIASNEQLLYVSTYIHRNIGQLSGWKRREHLYPWSSLKDCIAENRWPTLLKPSLVMDQFPSPTAYKLFVKESPAKSLEHELFTAEVESLLR